MSRQLQLDYRIVVPQTTIFSNNNEMHDLSSSLAALLHRLARNDAFPFHNGRETWHVVEVTSCNKVQTQLMNNDDGQTRVAFIVKLEVQGLSRKYFCS